MDVTTLIIAVVGVALAALSLGWQAAMFLLSGPRVKVYLREGFRGPRGVMVAPPDSYTEDGLRALTRMGYAEEVLGVETVNHGRLPVTVDRWSLQFGNRVAYDNPTDPRNPPLPHRLESFARAIWCAPASDLHDAQRGFSDQSDDAATLRAQAGLGSGRTISSRNALLVRADATRRPAVRLMRRLARRLARRIAKRRR